jgi:hypothetical protein
MFLTGGITGYAIVDRRPSIARRFVAATNAGWSLRAGHRSHLTFLAKVKWKSNLLMRIAEEISDSCRVICGKYFFISTLHGTDTRGDIFRQRKNKTPELARHAGCLCPERRTSAWVCCSNRDGRPVWAGRNAAVAGCALRRRSGQATCSEPTVDVMRWDATFSQPYDRSRNAIDHVHQKIHR